MFYEMLSRFKSDTFLELPEDIKDIFNEINISDLIQKGDDSVIGDLDFMWEKTKEICKKYIDTEWVDNLGIEKEILLDDIKLHSIFVNYLSIINENLEGRTIEQCVDDYCEYIDINRFKDDLMKWIGITANGEHSNGFHNSELCYYLDEGIRIIDYDNVLVNVNFEIFYEIISKWKECPYSSNNSKGMNFKKLSKFHKNFVKLVNRANDKLDRYTRLFIIERLFNISFLSKLVDSVNKDYIKSIKEYRECVERHKEEVKRQHDEKYAQVLLKQYEATVLENYDKYKIVAANKLFVLSEIVSIPMVFLRDKYIDMINISHEANVQDVNWYRKYRCSVYYLNSYLIPLLLRVFYIIVFFRYNNQKDKHEYIKKLLEEYIEMNSEKYVYKNFQLSYESVLKEGIEGEALQVNATEIIYNYNNHRNKFDEGKTDEDFI